MFFTFSKSPVRILSGGLPGRWMQALCLVSLLSLWSGCKPEPEACVDETDPACPNYDPCLSAPSAQSDFVIVAAVDIAGLADTLIDIEITKAFNVESPTFKPVADSMDAYRWQVGSDPRVFEEQDLRLNFIGSSGRIPVTLTAEVNDQFSCLEPSERTSSVTKEIDIIPQGQPYAIDGAFRGSLVSEDDDQEYTVRIGRFISGSIWRYLLDLPIPDDCDPSGRGVPIYVGYQYFVSSYTQEAGTPECRNLIVVGRIDHNDDDRLRIEYLYDDDDGSRKNLVFEGRRQ